MGGMHVSVMGLLVVVLAAGPVPRRATGDAPDVIFVSGTVVAVDIPSGGF